MWKPVCRISEYLSVSPVLLSCAQAYWRSCAALLGQVLETAFKDDYTVELLSTPEVPGRKPLFTLTLSMCLQKFDLECFDVLSGLC